RSAESRCSDDGLLRRGRAVAVGELEVEIGPEPEAERALLALVENIARLESEPPLIGRVGALEVFAESDRLGRDRLIEEQNGSAPRSLFFLRFRLGGTGVGCLIGSRRSLLCGRRGER